MSAQTLPSLDAALPSGGWTLYFHPAKEQRWHMDTFKVVATVRTWKELAQMLAAMTQNDWIRGKFFFCPETIPPLMENSKNIRGGSYSLRVDRSITGEIMPKYLIAAVLGHALTTPGDLISCVRITPRRDFNILQIWNRDSQTFRDPAGLLLLDSTTPAGEAKYVPHVEKKI